MGLLAYQETIVDTIINNKITSISAPRYNGKTYAALAAAVYLTGKTIYISRTFAAAKNAMRMAESSCDPRFKVRESRRTNGQMASILEIPHEGRILTSTIQYLVYGKNGGRGYHADTLIFDDADEVGDEHLGYFYPTVFNSKRMHIIGLSVTPDKGLAATIAGKADAYLHWRDEDEAAANPGLGQLIQKEHLDRAKDILPPEVYRHDCLGLCA